MAMTLSAPPPAPGPPLDTCALRFGFCVFFDLRDSPSNSPSPPPRGPAAGRAVGGGVGEAVLQEDGEEVLKLPPPPPLIEGGREGEGNGGQLL